MTNNALVYCPVCNSAIEKPLNEAKQTAAHHDDSRHQGETVARVFENGSVTPDEVNDLYDSLREYSREHRERFARRAITDDRFNITVDETPDRDTVREWVVRT